METVYYDGGLKRFDGTTVNSIVISGGSSSTVGFHVKDYGAAEDNVTDDTAAVQAAIDAASAVNGTVFVPQVCYIAGTLDIKRVVDGGQPAMTIDGMGSGGFRKESGNLFTSSLASPSGTPHPSAEGVIFRGVKFHGALASTSHTIDHKLLRLVFDNCEWRGMKFCNLPNNYLQSIYFSNPRVLKWSGQWMLVNNAYDVRGVNNRVEHGAAFYKNVGTYDSSSWVGGTMEGCSGLILDIANSKSSVVEKIYFEGNAGQDIKLGAGNFAIRDCWFYPTAPNLANANFWAVDIGTATVTSQNNYCFGRLYDNDSGVVHNTGDFAVTAVRKTGVLPPTVGGTWTPTWNGAGTIGVATAIYREVGDLVNVIFDLTCPASSGTAFAKFSGLPFPNVSNNFAGEIDLTSAVGASAPIKVLGGANYSGLGLGNTSFWAVKDRNGTPCTITEMSGKRIAGSLWYAK